MRHVQISLVGLPSSGKTTYLAALWAGLKPSDDPTAFHITTWPSNRAYLQEIADDWFAGRALDHTPTGIVGDIDFVISDGGQADLRIAVPDLSGEVYKRAVAHRLIERALVDRLVGSDAILFFVGAIDAKTPVCLTDLGTIDAGAARPPIGTDFDPESLESDWLNAELLQIVLTLLRDADRDPPPVAFIVSAWDKVESLGLAPEDWLLRTQPALAQLVNELNEHTSTCVIGVSAQGGDYATNPEVTASPPHSRAVVRVGNAVSSDVTTPLRWLLDQN